MVQMNLYEIKDRISLSNKSLLHFTADWCQPCKRMLPTIDILLSENKDIEYIKIDIDTQPEIAKEYNISSVPTFIATSSNRVIRKSGAMPLPELRKMFEQPAWTIVDDFEYNADGKIMVETDAMGREKFWEDLGRPNA